MSDRGLGLIAVRLVKLLSIQRRIAGELVGEGKSLPHRGIGSSASKSVIRAGARQTVGGEWKVVVDLGNSCNSLCQSGRCRCRANCFRSLKRRVASMCDNLSLGQQCQRVGAGTSLSRRTLSLDAALYLMIATVQAASLRPGPARLQRQRPLWHSGLQLLPRSTTSSIRHQPRG